MILLNYRDISLEHLLVLEHPNGIQTVIFPHLDPTMELVGSSASKNALDSADAS